MKLMKILASLLLLLLFTSFAKADIVVSGGGTSDIYGPLPSFNNATGSNNNSQQPIQPPPPTPPQQTNQNNTGNSGSSLPSIPTSGNGGSSGGSSDYSQPTYSPNSGSLISNPFDKTVLLTPPPTDLSMGYLRSIFGTVDGVLGSGGSQILGKMFGTFNAVILSLGGIILMYIVIVSTLSTAHEGEVMGKKWSSIWIPLRAALGVGFLVPKTSGYSLIQILMMWLVTQGIGAADSVWNSTLDYLKSGGVIVNIQKGSNIPNKAAVLTTVGDSLKSLVCMYGLQKILIDQQTRNPSAPRVQALYSTLKEEPTGSGIVEIPGPIPDYPGYNGVCGKISWDVTSDTEKNQSYKDASFQILASLSDTAQQLVNMVTNPPPPPNPPKYPSPAGYFNAVLDYNSFMLPIMNRANVSAGLQSGIQTMKNDGWIMAGTYYFVITKNTSQTLEALKPPSVAFDSTATLQKLQKANKTLFDPDGPYFGQVLNFIRVTGFYLDMSRPKESEYLPSRNKAPQFPPFSSGLAMKILNLDVIKNSFWYADVSAFVRPIDERLNDYLVSPLNLLMDALFSYGTGNPIEAIAFFGNGLVAGAYALWISSAAVAIGLSVISAIVPLWGPAFVGVINAVTMWMIPFIGALVAMGFLGGLMAAFYIPLIPFILFTFGSIGWFVGVIETIVAAPLVAIGLMSPEGDEAFGKASPAIMLITSVFLRPSLMLFGYISGIIMSYVGLWLLTRGFIYSAVSILTFTTSNLGTNATTLESLIGNSWPSLILTAASLPGTIAFILLGLLSFIVIYCFLAVIVVQKAFELISAVPDSVLRWIGGTDKGPGAHFAEGMGEKAQQKAEGAAKEGSQLFSLQKPEIRQAPAEPEKKGDDTIQSGGAGGAAGGGV